MIPAIWPDIAKPTRGQERCPRVAEGIPGVSGPPANPKWLRLAYSFKLVRGQNAVDTSVIAQGGSRGLGCRKVNLEGG